MKLAASLLVLLLAAPVAASILHAQCNDPAVLITGGVTSFDPGNATQTAELYDPKTDTFIQVGEMIDARIEHTATRLLDGSVLVVGGFALAGGSALASAELFDPATKTFRLAANMH
jgi:Galactose oxidase, central domain